MNNQLRWAQDYLKRYANLGTSQTEMPPHFNPDLYNLALAIVADEAESQKRGNINIHLDVADAEMQHE